VDRVRLQAVPINPAPHVNRYAEVSCDEPFILIIQAPQLKWIMNKELCPGALFHWRVPRARCALTVVAGGDVGVWSPGGIDGIDCAGY
jgi:hypothetical protein